MYDFEALQPPPWSADHVDRYWREVRRLAALRKTELLDALDDLTTISDLPTWLLLFIFHSVWNAVLNSTPPKPSVLRSLRLPFESIEHRAIDEGLEQSVDAVRQLCRYLPEIFDDDLNWTGFTLPGEK